MAEYHRALHRRIANIVSRMDARFLAKDGLHPSGSAYSEWTAQVEPVAREALTR